MSSEILLALAIAGGAILVMLVKQLIDYFIGKAEAKEIKAAVEKSLSNFRAGKAEEIIEDDNVLSAMERNVGELQEYYTISKRQARQSFTAAMMACILGFAIYAAGILLSYHPEYTGSAAYSAIGGSMVEVIAGLFFWMYSKALDQMNKYHDSLLETQNQLSSIELGSQMDPNNKNRAYAYIITKLMDKEQDATLTTVDIDGEAIANSGKDAANDTSTTIASGAEKAAKSTASHDTSTTSSSAASTEETPKTDEDTSTNQGQ